MAKRKKAVLKTKITEAKAAEIPGQMQKKQRIYVPLTLYYLKDFLRDIANHKYFPSSILAVFAMISVSIAFPFYPLAILIPLLIALFFLSRVHPLVGLTALLFLALPMIAYQAPLLAWFYLIFVGFSILVGYKYADAVTVLLALIMLPFSYLGYIFEIPAFVMGILFLGFKRSIIVTVLALAFIVMISGLTGIHNTAPLFYNQAGFRSSFSQTGQFAMLTPSKSILPLGKFLSGFVQAFYVFFSIKVWGSLLGGMELAVYAFFYNIEITSLQIVVWIIAAFTIINHVVNSRSEYKGTEAGLYSLIVLFTYAFMEYTFAVKLNPAVLFGFILVCPITFILELNDVNIVRALEMMKKDFLDIFGGALEDLTTGTRETFNDIGDYEETKKELTEAVMEPMEHREIKGAYNIKPAKGILLFGPPGTGKTLLMRAVSNEVRSKFFYVKTSSLLYNKGSDGNLAKIFSTAKKNAPVVLFFDEIDGIAGAREASENESTKLLLSMLLSEMDGFQKIDGVVIVGSTNMPQLLDPSIMRPGRFDKIIYVPLPDKEARIAVFKHYSGKYPMASDTDFEKLAEITHRFSNADILNVCSEAARHVARIALEESKAMKISTEDLERVIRHTKPSVSLARLESYAKFRMDYERRMYQEEETPETPGVTMEDVIGMEDAKNALHEALEMPMQHPKLMQDYHIHSITGILLFGPPGTGKTMIMKAVAHEIGEYKTITISGDELMEKGYEEAVEIINDIFNRAVENSPSVIVIDEIDSLAPKRDGNNNADVRITGEFLRQLDRLHEISGVILVGTTNRPDAMDPAMIRPGRFDKLIFAGPPGSDDRINLFAENLGGAPESDVDLKKISKLTEGYTGADIANICREAKVESLEDRIKTGVMRKITTEDMIRIIKKTKPSAPERVMDKYQSFLYLHERI